ncbi:MAG: YfiR family protein [Acidobacteriaceae bacterium]|jgi:hypothetical protein
MFSDTGAKPARRGMRKLLSWSVPSPRIRLPALSSVLLFAFVLHAAVPNIAVAQPASDEDQVKAAFLFHFAQLVQWPPDAFSSGELLLCTLEDDPLYDELESTLQGRQIGSRTIRVRQVHASQAAHDCNMLVIDKTENRHLPSLLVTLRNVPVLTVGETDDFLNCGGMIRFRLVDNKLRFDINLAAADSSRLRISSQLLLLSSSVTRAAIDKGR